MDERKQRPAHERLYVQGKAKLRGMNQSKQAPVEPVRLQGTCLQASILDRTAGDKVTQRLYDDHKNKQVAAASKAREREEAERKLACTTFKAPESSELLVRAFRKEFAVRLSETMGLDPSKRSYLSIHNDASKTQPLTVALAQEQLDDKLLADPRGVLLEYSDVEEILQRMGFVKPL